MINPKQQGQLNRFIDQQPDEVIRITLRNILSDWTFEKAEAACYWGYLTHKAQILDEKNHLKLVKNGAEIKKSEADETWESIVERLKQFVHAAPIYKIQNLPKEVESVGILGDEVTEAKIQLSGFKKSELIKMLLEIFSANWTMQDIEGLITRHKLLRKGQLSSKDTVVFNWVFVALLEKKLISTCFINEE